MIIEYIISIYQFSLLYIWNIYTKTRLHFNAEKNPVQVPCIPYSKPTTFTKLHRLDRKLAFLRRNNERKKKLLRLWLGGGYRD